jgi:hypothetical protein
MLIENLISNMSIFLAYIFSRKYFLVKYTFIKGNFLPVIRWLLSYQWKQVIKPYKTVGLQATINHLYSMLDITDINVKVILSLEIHKTHRAGSSILSSRSP